MNAIDYRLAAMRLASPVRSGTTFTRLTFRGGLNHNAADTAGLWLEASGFSVGPRDAVHNKRAVLFGRYAIPAWGDLPAADLAQVNGVVRDDLVDDVSVVEILPDAPPAAIAAAQDRWAA